MKFSVAACSEEHHRCATSVIAAYFLIPFCATSAAPNWRMRLASAGQAVVNHLEVWRLFATLRYQSVRHLLPSAQPHIYLVGPSSSRHLGPGPPPSTPSTPSTLLGETTFPNAHVMNIFGCFLQAISDQNKCTCTFFVPPPPPLPPNHHPPTHTHPLLQLQLPQDG